MDRTNKYVERLAEEWRQHGKIIIGVDFDDTVSPWKLATMEDCERVLKLLRECKVVGCYIVGFTACNEDRFDHIKEYFHSHGIEIDAINENPIALQYGNRSKIYANIFVDDRAGLEETLSILENAMILQRASKYSSVTRDEIG